MSGLANEFWKDVPEEYLEELCKNLDESSEMMMSTDFDSQPLDYNQQGFMNNMQVYGQQQQYQQQQQQAQFAQQQQAQQQQAQAQNGLPPLFQTNSFTNVSNIRSEQPMSFSQQTRIPVQVRPEMVQCRSTLESLATMETQQEQQLEKLRQVQQQLIMNPTEQAAYQLQEQQWKFSQQIDLELKELQSLNRSVIMDAPELHQSRVLALRLQIQQQRVELYRHELQNLCSPQQSQPCIAMLVIPEQPIPQVLFKSKSIDDHYTIQLITGAHQDIQSLSRVKATLMMAQKSKKKSAVPVENDEASIDVFQRLATFHSLKVNVSTRMSMVYLKFQVNVAQSTGNVAAIESNPSYPIIVITNESQWCEAEGKLLLMDTFSGQPEITWPQFANGLHHHFLKATRQNPSNPSRALSLNDFSYMHARLFDSNPVVTQAQVNRFWQWFGPVTQTLRFKRHINTLWFQGLIYGIITKQECTQILETQEEGTFMLRFSESFPGLFGVGYVSDDPYERVKHYLIKPEDTGSQKTLPDFLREKPQFKYLYQVDIASGIMCKYAKDSVLASYYSKTKRVHDTNTGYVLL